jgi:hypothetical protein
MKKDTNRVLLPDSSALWFGLVLGAFVAGGLEGLRRAGILTPPTPNLPANWYGLLLVAGAAGIGLVVLLMDWIRVLSWRNELRDETWSKATSSEPEPNDSWWLAGFRQALALLEQHYDRQAVVEVNANRTRDSYRAQFNAQLAPALIIVFLVPVLGFLVRWYNLAASELAANSGLDRALVLFWGSLGMIPVVLIAAFLSLLGRMTFETWASIVRNELNHRSLPNKPTLAVATNTAESQTPAPTVDATASLKTAATVLAATNPPARSQQSVPKPTPRPTTKTAPATTSPSATPTKPTVESLFEEDVDDSILEGMTMDDL